MEKQLDTATPHDGNWHILVIGFPSITKPLVLASGISLRPLAQPLSIFDLAASGAAGFDTWAVLVPVAAACTCEIETARDANTTPGYDTLNRAWLVSALLVLRGFTRHLCVACSAYSWNLVAGHQSRTAPIFHQQLAVEGVENAVFKSKRDLPRFHGKLLDFHLSMISISAARADEITELDATWVRDRFDTFNRLAADNEPFRFALQSSIDWRYAKDARSAVARLWSGIEAIFGINSELVYRISLLSASLLASRGHERKEKFNEVKQLYGLRSKAVHGEAMTEAKLAQALNGSFRLLAELLLLSVERGHALSQDDFDRAVFD
jgi:hypothetical protein